jgi:hypothetical protein
VANLTTRIAAAVRDRGTQVFGHLKASLDVPGCGLVVFSLTGAEIEPQRRGALAPGITRHAEVRVNAILCGIDKAALQPIVDEALHAARGAL